MKDHLFPAPEVMSLPVQGTDMRFPVHRIFCVGRNYEAHAAEMGAQVHRDAPFYFTKSNQALCPSGRTVPYPPGTESYHYEMEAVVAIGRPGFRIAAGDAPGHVLGHACGLDMTRRDLQARAKERRQPWDVAKDVESSAVIGAITPVALSGPLGARRISLELNGALRQDATLDQMIWSVPEIIADLSRLYHLRAGDLIMTGTPAGVGPVAPGDHLVGRIDGLEPVELTIGPADPA